MLENVANTLAAIKSRGAYATRLFAGVENLHLEVKGVGTIRFPISLTQARKLCAVARRAGFGWREKTLVDPDVRDTWEIASGKVKIDQRKWKKTLDPQLEHIKRDLGLPDEGKLKAQLYKMLVYEPGQFFVPHQDSEKAGNMVGTLTVVLPSVYQGGSAIIEHRDEKITYRTSSRSTRQLAFIAFYADCRHEIRPVIKGYRVSLVYNLIFDGPAVSAISFAEAQSVDKLARYVDAHFTTPRSARGYLEKSAERPDKLVYLLDHEYTQRSLSWKRLKNGDGLRAAVLRAVAGRLDCEISLALADVHEIWSCEGDDYYDCQYRGRRYDPYDEGDDDPESLDLIELIDEDIELRHWIDASGKPVKSVTSEVSWNELCCTKASVDFDPFRSEHEGWMGNYGNTVDRWYHRAAVVLWPRSRSFAIRAKLSPEWAVDELWKQLETGSLEVAQERARSLLPFWSHRALRVRKKGFLTKTLRVAEVLDDRKTAASLLGPFRLHQLGVQAMPYVIALLDKHGIDWSRKVFGQWAGSDNYDYENYDKEWLGFMPTFCRKLCESGGDAGQELARWIVARQWSLIKKQCEGPLKDKAHPHALAELTTLSKSVAYVLVSCVASSSNEVRDQILDFLTADNPGYPVQCLVPILREARKNHAPKKLKELGLGALHRHCVTGLDADLAEPIRNANDWSIFPPMKCSCVLCRQLARFLADRDRVRFEWPLAQEKRRHVHAQLDEYNLPVIHTTRREGRPYTLILVKMKALFTREAERRRSQQYDLAWLNRHWRAFSAAQAAGGVERRQVIVAAAGEKT